MLEVVQPEIIYERLSEQGLLVFTRGVEELLLSPLTFGVRFAVSNQNQLTEAHSQETLNTPE